MNKYLKIALVVALVGGDGWMLAFKRNCESGEYTKAPKDYAYVLVVTSAQAMPTNCYVTLTTEEKNFIRSELAKFSAATKVTRQFYVDNIKNAYNASKPVKAKGQTKNKIIALRRVVRDFGGSKQGRAEHKVGDILKMLDGKLKEIGEVQASF